MATTIHTYDELLALPTGEPFSIRITRSMTYREVHGIFYRTANREVTLTLRSGIKVSGTLDESPGFFALQRLWLRVPGRKTRKGVMLDDVRHLRGFKAPTLAEVFTAFIGVTSGNPSEELLQQTRDTLSKM